MMANIVELTPEQRAEYDAWVASRPLKVQEMIVTHPPTKLYRLSDTNQRVTIHSYSEDGTVSVVVSGKYNAVVFDRRVSGIPLSDLTECELPVPDEPVGTVLTHPLDVQIFVDEIRPLVLNNAQKSKLVKELHDKSGIGLTKCARALVEHNWDIEAAIKTLIRQSNERNRW